MVDFALTCVARFIGVSRYTCANGVSQLKNFVRLVALKSSPHQSQHKMLAASCHHKVFVSLLKMFMAGVTIVHNDLHVILFISKCCMLLLMI